MVEAIICYVARDQKARKSDLAKTKKALEEKNKEVELRETKLKEFEQKLEEEQTKRKIAGEPTIAKIVNE